MEEQTKTPSSMIAIEIARHGGPEVLRSVMRPVPHPGRREILVRVAAAGVNRPDLMQRQGRYPPPQGITDIPGLEVAGTVVSVGAAARRWHPGDKVCALVAGGGYANYCVVPDSQALPIPIGLNVVEAAALPETYFTVWTNLFGAAALRKGERILVHGGSGGIGTTAIQLAHVMGASVYTTAGSDRKCAACHRLGAALAINYRRKAFDEVILGATGGEGVDVILDMVGGTYIQRDINILRPGGRLVMISFLQGRKADLDLGPLLSKRLTIFGSTLRSRSVVEKGAIARSLEKKVWAVLRNGKIAPVIDSEFPLVDVAAAHARMESGKHVGKIVLIVPPSRNDGT